MGYEVKRRIFREENIGAKFSTILRARTLEIDKNRLPMRSYT